MVFKYRIKDKELAAIVDMKKERLHDLEKEQKLLEKELQLLKNEMRLRGMK